ncbi:MAG: DUF1697 domain-containing protein [Ignavibacteriaceae bacterium]
METFISILRGINVSGHRKVPMNELKSLYEEAGFKEVITYIQSGNVIFKTNKKLTSESLGKILEKKIDEKFNLDVPVIVRPGKEIENILSHNPFLKMHDVNVEKLHVTFLEKAPAQSELQKIKEYDYSPDRFIIKNKEVFLYCPGGYGKTKLSNNFFENKLKVQATTRNWKTINKLGELASGK